MDCIKFKVNGVEHTVGSDVCSDTMLLEYLRNYLQLRGTKYNCREGGCGACMVTAARTPGSPHVAINSCLTSVASCHGWDIRTIEGLGNEKDGYHKLQKAVGETNATQCGYCTPGMIMAMHGLIESNPNLTMLDVEKSLSSNLCRCTGYRPLLDVFKNCAKDAPKEKRIMDIKDVSCRSSGNCCQSSNNAKEDGWCVVRQDDYQDEGMITIKFKDGKKWYRPTTLEECKKLLEANSESYMLVGGNTSKGAYPINEYPNAMIDVNHISELKVNEIDQNCIIGAGCTMTELLDIFTARAKEANFNYFTTLIKHLKLVAHIPLRNVATIAGNLMIKHTYNAYQSDMYLMLDTVGAELTIMDYYGYLQTVTMPEFLKLNMKGKIIVNMLFPPLSQEYKVFTYKLMPRAQSSHAIVNFGFLVKLDSSNVVQEVKMCYGALSAAFGRAVATESYLLNKELFTNETLQGALKVLNGEIIVEDHPPEPSVEYRRNMALVLFYKAILTLSPKRGARYESAIVDIHESRLCSTAKQTYDTDTALWPFNQPMPKLEAMIQSSGEAEYTDDIHSMHNEVFGAFVLSTVGIGTITKMDPSEALAIPGVVAFYTCKDIPGLNSFTPADSGVCTANEEVLCEGNVKYNGQPIGIVVAETQNAADRASRLVKVTYTNVSNPVTDINVAKDDSTRNTLFITAEATNPGTDTVYKTIKGCNILRGQYHFPMETMVCVAKPTDEGLEVHTSSQWLDGPHTMISRCLNIDQNKINLHVKRVGGSYGLKITRSMQCIVACSLVAHKLNRPCRFIQPLTTNLKGFGKRMPNVHVYEVAVNKSGVIQKLDITNYTDNGYKVNEPVIGYGYDVYHNVYDASKINYTAYNTVTDTPKNTFCRSPGTLEAIANMEIIMDRIACELSMDHIQVRLNNLNKDKYGGIIELLEALKESSEYTSREAAVNAFNKQNRWKKRAIRCCLCRWVPVGGVYTVVNISVYHSDASVVITHGGVEMGQGLNTKIAQIAARLLKCPLAKIKIRGNNTDCSPNAFVTGGSVTCDTITIAMGRAAASMHSRFEPIRNKIKQNQETDSTWVQLVSLAYAENIDLQFHGCVTPADALTYDIFGVVCCEVEVDCLTGEHEILRTDIMQDVGLSISPEIDVGQVEGGFMMGVGYHTCEKLIYGSDGTMLTDRSWDYHLGGPRDIPQNFNVTLKNIASYNSSTISTLDILGAKAVGEPPCCLAIAVPLAIIAAAVACQIEMGKSTIKCYDVDGPLSTEKICAMMDFNIEEYLLR